MTLEIAKNLSDRLANGEKITDEEMQNAVNNLNPEECIDLFFYCLKQKG